jgi:hypothetical protein
MSYLHYWCLFAYSDVHYHHDMTELLLKVVLNTINQTNTHCFALCTLWCHFLWIVQFWKFLPYSLTFIHRIFFKYSPRSKSFFFLHYWHFNNDSTKYQSWLFNLLTLRVPDESDSRNTLRTLNLLSTFSLFTFYEWYTC